LIGSADTFFSQAKIHCALHPGLRQNRTDPFSNECESFDVVASLPRAIKSTRKARTRNRIRLAAIRLQSNLLVFFEMFERLPLTKKYRGLCARGA
jgi:hypothetical protein